MLAEDARFLGQRQRTWWWHRRQHELWVHFSSPCHPRTMRGTCGQWVCIIAEELWASEPQPTPQKKVLPLLSWSGDKSTLCPRGRHYLYLQAVCYTNILEMIVWNKIDDEVQKNQRELSLSGYSLESPLVHLESLSISFPSEKPRAVKVYSQHIEN